MKRIFNDIKSDLYLFCRRKHIAEMRKSDHLFQYNNTFEYPKFLDLNEPLLITGMRGVGACYFGLQLMHQALTKGYVVFDKTDTLAIHLKSPGNSLDLKNQKYSYIDTIKGQSSFVKSHESLGPYVENDQATVAIFDTTMVSDKGQSAIENCQDFSNLPKALSDIGIKVLVVSLVQEPDKFSELEHSHKNIVVAIDWFEHFDLFSNRIHLRDTLHNQTQYGMSRKDAGDLQSNKLGHGYCHIKNRTPIFCKLYHTRPPF
ncbi:MAG: hypothetical protein RSG77_19515 [Hafnia sp.]